MPKTLREEFPSVIDVAYGEYRKQKHVSEIMTTDVVFIEPQMDMLDAARIMGERHIGSLLVEGEQRPSGIVTERDLLTRVIAANRDPKKVKVLEVMSPRLVTITPYISIKEAARTMIKQRGRLVIMEERTVAGIVTASDLIRSMPEAPETSMLVKSYMTKEVRMVSPYEKVLDIARLMGKERIGSVLVKKEGKPWGIFTERDLLSKIIYLNGSLEEIVEVYTSSPIVTIESKYSIHKAAQTMVNKHVRRLPVLDGERLSGIITARDLVEAYSV